MSASIKLRPAHPVSLPADMPCSIDCGEEWDIEDDRAVIASEFGWLLREIEGGAS
jgi:hypothetical protein